MSKLRPAYFDNRNLPEASPVYVCWLDVMGSQNAMLRSVKTAANFVCKIHDVVLDEWPKYEKRGIRLFPVMDGVYIVSSRKGPLQYFVASVLRRLAETFLQEKTPQFRFLVRGCIAYGPLVDGRNIPPDASRALNSFPTYRDSILLGIPLAQAYRGESEAPPFGIFVDESARAFCAADETPFPFVWWDWYTKVAPCLDVEDMHKALMDHFDWCKQYNVTIGYKPDRIESHMMLADEYFHRNRRFVARCDKSFEADDLLVPPQGSEESEASTVGSGG